MTDAIAQIIAGAIFAVILVVAMTAVMLFALAPFFVVVWTVMQVWRWIA